MKIIILAGLPGSGKTTFSENYKKINPKTAIISLDKVKEKFLYVKRNDLERLVSAGFSGLNIKKIDTIVIDGLFLTKKDVEIAIKNVQNRFSSVEIEIHQWNEDRETCIKNDGGRRDVPSIDTIENARYEIMRAEDFRDILGGSVESVSVVRHDVQLKPDWKRVMRRHVFVDDDDKLRSDKWVIGGEYGNCWDDHMTPATVEDDLEFTAFDKLLEEIAPNITYLHYKKIKSECISTELSYSYDYYGGHVSYMNWVCDLKRLYEMIKEFGY